MLDVSFTEVMVLLVIALLVLGPDKLPKFAADAGRFVRTLRRMASDARSEVRDSLGPELSELGLYDLDPRSLARRHLLDDEEDDLDPRRRGAPSNGSAANGSAANGSAANGSAANGSAANGSAADGGTPNRSGGSSRMHSRAEPSARSGDGPPYDADAT